MGLDHYKGAFEYLGSQATAEALLAAKFGTDEVRSMVAGFRYALGLVPPQQPEPEPAERIALRTRLDRARRRVVKVARMLETELAALERLLAPVRAQLPELAPIGQPEQFKGQVFHAFSKARRLGVPFDLVEGDFHHHGLRDALTRLAYDLTAYANREAASKAPPSTTKKDQSLSKALFVAAQECKGHRLEPRYLAALDCLARGTFDLTQTRAARRVKHWDGWLARSRNDIARLTRFVKELDADATSSSSR